MLIILVLFVIHSADLLRGNQITIILRIALTSNLLGAFKNKFFEFVSFGSPHLSLINLSHTILNSFLGIYQTISKSRCIDQLHLKDSIDPRQSLLYKLSQDTCLSYFKHVRLYGSVADRYVPLSSTLVIPEGAAESNKSLNTIKYRQSLPSIPSSHYPANKSPNLIYEEMLENLSSKIENSGCLEKFEICFRPEHQDFLGRRAHLSLVQDSDVLERVLIANRFHLCPAPAQGLENATQV
jgi:hypothetical protein